MKKIVRIILGIAIIGLIAFYIPKFLNFIEIQDDMKSGKQSQVFQIEPEPINIENITVSCNIPIPEDIRLKMEQEQKEKEEIKRQEEAKVLAAKVQKEKEAKKKAETKIAKQETKVTSRGSADTRETSEEGYTPFVATGYCPCSSCCGKTTGITASGAKAKAGVTVAMPSNYSFGTQIQIKGMGTYTVQDRGGAIKGNKIDIFFNTHQDALNFGRRTVYLKIL